jgi:hypothetical protein
MTEDQWLSTTNIDAMLEHLGNDASDRKLRLFACGGVRSMAHLLTEHCSRHAVKIAERYADGLVNKRSFGDSRKSIRAKERGVLRAAVFSKSRDDGNSEAIANKAAIAWAATWDAARGLLRAGAMDAGRYIALAIPIAQKADTPNNLLHTDLSIIARDIFGNPFRPVTVHPDWLTWNDGTVPKLAQTIYDDRRFDLLPILADALEEAGCDSADILAHCRGPGPHVRGCWVVDLLLGKE